MIRFLEKIELFLYRKAARIVSVTHSFRRILGERGIDTSKIEVITNGVDATRFQPRKKDSDLVAKLGLEGRFVAGYVGTHGMAHALETILEVASMAKVHGDPFSFVLLGDGARKAELRRQAQVMSLDNVIFIDSVPKGEVARYWSLLDVSIIHLRKTELFTSVIPSKLFECMAMGIPVLHGVAGESAEIVENEGVGMVFEPEHAEQLYHDILRLSQDKRFYDQLQQQCLRAASRYDRYELAVEMLELLKQITSEVRQVRWQFR